MSDVEFVKIKSIKRAGVEKVYDLQTKKNHNFFANGILAHNCLIFQESVMDLAEVVGGFPKDQCDNVRRAIMKRDLSKGDAAIKEAKKMEDDFVAGAVKNGVPEAAARKSYEQILWFAGYGFNRAHAVAYAIDSYMCAWLLTHYEEEWLCAYLESMSKNPEDRAKAFGEIKGMGYQIVPIDINYATNGWTILPGKKFMPSFLSCKGVGESAVEEIIANRPYKTIEDLLWDEDGTWRHSKFNKKALDALIKIGAFQSMDLIGEDKLFSSYHHMHEVIVENMDAIKKTSKKDPHIGRKNFFEIARGLHPEMEEWSRRELAEFSSEFFGTLDVTMLHDPDVFRKFEEKGIRPIEQLEQGETDICWFAIQDYVVKTTKTKKQYLQMNVIGPVGKPIRLNLWGWKGNAYEPYELCFAEVKRDDFGCSTTSWKLKTI